MAFVSATRRSSLAACSLFLSVFLAASAAAAATLRVGVGKAFSTPCSAMAAAAPNDVIEVDAATYTDSCSIGVPGLTLRGVGGRPKIDLSGTDHPASYKGIYVIDADNVTIENLELTGANISCGNGANAAALRIQANNVTVRRCYIHDNQNGILGGAGTTTVEYSELYRNGLGDGCNCGGCTHNLYIDSGELVFRYNLSRTIATDGHLLKSRAERNQIYYNRFSGEDGHDSYAVDIPNGGFTVLVGNVLEKGPNPGNVILFNWGEEGGLHPDHRVFVVNNTFVNDASQGTFINLAAGGVLTAHNNIFVGPGTIASTGPLSADNLTSGDPLFVDRSSYDYHLLSGSPAIDVGVDPGTVGSVSLLPTEQYLHPAGSEARAIVGSAIDLGAFEFGSHVTTPDAGVPVRDAAVLQRDAGASLHDAAPAGTDASAKGRDPAGIRGGCGCTTTGPTFESGALLLLVAGVLLLRRTTV